MEKTPEELQADQQEAELKAKADAEANEKKEAEKKDLENKSKEEIYEELRKTRSEAKERRLKEKELSEKLAEFEKKQADEDEKEKKAKGKYQEIIDGYKKKLEELEPLANEHKTYVTTRKEALKKSLEEKEHWMESFTKLSLTELEELNDKFKTGSEKSPTNSSNKFVKDTNGKDTREPWEKMMSN